MCELTFINTRNQALNRNIGYALAFVNSAKHKDGVGFSQGDMVWKSYLQACTITNLYPLMYKHIETTAPLMLHTRFASIGIQYGKEVCDANAHPFEGEKFILSHNGTLTPKTAITVDHRKELGPIGDSQYFLTQLEKSEKPGLIEALNETMPKFTGKFAFLIHDRRDNKNYAVRGWSATLFWVPITDLKGKVLGYVINTEKDDLIRGLVLAKNISTSDFDFALDKIEELKRETIYALDGKEPVEVGSLKENFPYTAPTTTTVSTWTGGGHRSTTTTAGNNGPYSGKRFAEFCFQYAISIPQAEMIVLSFLGKNIAGLDEKEIKWLDDVLTPEFIKRTDKKKLEAWMIITSGYTDNEVYMSGLNFPYFLEELPTLMRLANKVEDRFKKGIKTDA